MRTTLTAALAALAAAAVPYMFSAGTPARSAEVNANFADLDARVTTVATDLTAVRAQLATGGTATTPAKIATAETDFAQLEEGATPAATGRACDAAGTTCVYRLTAGPFVFTTTDQSNYPHVCVAPCPEEVGRIFYFPAPDDATALTIAAASTASAPAVRWLWRSFSYGDPWDGQTGVLMRYLVRPGENLYSYHPSSPGMPADGTTPTFIYVSAVGHWSGYHPY